MTEKGSSTRLGIAMRAAGVSALALSRECGVSNSLVSRWQQGTRPLTSRSKAIVPLAKALLKLDTEGNLDEHLLPYRAEGENKEAALCVFLVQKDEPDLPPRAEIPEIPHSGEYIAQHRVLLGQKGFRKAALVMLDYLMALPPGREVVVLCQGRYDWLVKDLVFVLQFLAKLKRAVDRGARLTVINRRGYSIAETSAFAGPWLAAHMKGYIRSLYYDGELPEGDRFIASIKGFWCGYAMEDDTAEDSLYLTLHTDPRDIRRGELLCESFRKKSSPASQYKFLQSPEGSKEEPKLWEKGALPRWPQSGSEAPSGAFFSLTSTPSFGIMTQAEWADVCGADTPPNVPEYLFSADGTFAEGPHRIILCKEAVREALRETRSLNMEFSALLQRKAYVTKDVLTAQLSRLLNAAMERDDFEVALVPRKAFSKLNLELVCWHNSASVGWLQSGEESVFANDRATSGSFYGYLDYAWDKLQKGWKRKRHVLPLLRKWLADKELDVEEVDSVTVRNWDALPKQ